ncbi:hypothetical protein ATANTOWER_012378, partial [Ataeniobius toweri]|nr:hypothetical protein [Ataeniobius toweri]
MSLHGAEKWEESRRLCMSEQETTMPFTLQQRNSDHEEECLKEKAEKEYYKNRYFQSQAEFFKVNSKCKSCIDCEEISIAFENLSSGGNCRGLKKELCREMTAKEHSKTRYLQSQTGLLRVQSLWENFKKKLERKITELQHKSSCGNENNTDLKREITKLSLVLDEFCVQAEVWQQKNNQPQSFLKQISSPKEFFSVELEQNEDRCYELSDAGSVDQDMPKVQKHGEINTPGSKQEETSAGKAKKPKDTHCITAHTKSEVRVLSVQEGFGSTLESEAQNCELEQIKAVRQRHDSEHSMETRRLDVQEGTKQVCFLLKRHCDHKTSLFKKTAKKEYYKRKCLGSQVELFKLYLKRKYFNNRSEDKTTKFENVSSICINLQRQIFKLKSEKEHYTNQCLQLQAGLLRVHSMWENLKTQLESNMSELQNVNLSGKHDNLDLGTEIDELGLALDELLIQLKASEQNCNQTQNLLKPNKNTANWTFSAEVEQTEHRRYTFVDSEDKQCDVPKVQDLILSLKIKAPESAQEETFAATTEELQDTHCISIEAKSERLDLLKVEKFSTLFDPKVTECEREQTSTLGSVFLKERQDTKQSKGSQCLCLPEAERTKLFSLQKRVCDLEAELSKGNDEKENYKKLLDKSQAELLEMHAMLNNFNQKPEEKTAVPLNVSSSGNDSNDDVGENFKGLRVAADAFEFQAQRIEDLAEKHKKLTEPKETDPKDTFSSEVKHDEHTYYMFLDSENEHPVVPRHDAEQNKESLSVCTPEAEITKLFSLQQRNCDLEAELLNEKGEKDYYKKLYDKSQTELLELRAT